MTQSFHFSDKVQHCHMGRHDDGGAKFLLLSKIRTCVESVTCTVKEFVELYSKAFVSI
jgi:hypothetical protein